MTRTDLEQAAQKYFARLAEADRHTPRGFDAERLDEVVGYEIDLARTAIQQVDDQLRNNTFAGDIQIAAAEIEGHGPAVVPRPVQPHPQSSELAARATREMLRLYIHRLSTPALRYEPYDDLFSSFGSRPTHAVAPISLVPTEAVTVAAASAAFLTRTLARGVGQSHITELRRGLGWLAEVVGAETDLRSVSIEQMKAFRDNLQKLDKSLQGRSVPFAQRQSGDPDRQITYATSSRYWRGIQAFFDWAVEDCLLSRSPADVAKIPKPKGTTKRSPPPFTTDELQRLLDTPLFTGHLGRKRVVAPGTCLVRGGKWWSAVLFMHTGLRAGELSQLEPADFVFDHEVPHLKVREAGELGPKGKSVKNLSAIRDVPLHPRLLELGLRQFVAARQKSPGKRLFEEFRLGTNGRKSEGATRFWGDYLHRFNLWQAGRATHVWRHTVVAFLRSNGVPVEDIASVVGHAGTDALDGGSFGQTKGYGGAYGLPRKREAILKLDFGFDLTNALGGPFDPNRHI